MDKRARQRRSAAGGRASFSSITDPAARAEALRQRALKANAARQLKYPPKGRRKTFLDYEHSVELPADAFTASDSDGEWETIGDEE